MRRGSVIVFLLAALAASSPARPETTAAASQPQLAPADPDGAAKKKAAKPADPQPDDVIPPFTKDSKKVRWPQNPPWAAKPDEPQGFVGFMEKYNRLFLGLGALGLLITFLYGRRSG